MAVPEIHEAWDSRKALVALQTDQNTRTLKYFVSGTDDEGVVSALVEALIPNFWEDYRFISYDREPMGGGNWTITVNYGKQKPGLMTFNFDTTGGKEKVTQAQCDQTTGDPFSIYYPAKSGATGPDPDFHGAIQVSDSGGKTKVEGVEITVPKFAFTVTRRFGPGEGMDGSVVEMLFRLTGVVNQDTIDVVISGIDLHFDPGTLKFVGATGQQASGGTDPFLDPQWEGEMTLKFEVELNLTAATIAGVKDVDKDGWDYLWVSYDDDVDAASGRFIASVSQVNVDRVYPRDDLGPLFFGAPAPSS